MGSFFMPEIEQTMNITRSNSEIWPV